MVNNKCDKLHATDHELHATELHSGYTQVSLVSPGQVHVVGGTYQGVAQLQQEFFPRL